MSSEMVTTDDGNQSVVPDVAKLPHDRIQELIEKTMDSLQEFLLAKNDNYQSSAFHPSGVFNKHEAETTVRVRLDDKLKRIESAEELRKNDLADLIGYLVILSVMHGWTYFLDLVD